MIALNARAKMTTSPRARSPIDFLTAKRQRQAPAAPRQHALASIAAARRRAQRAGPAVAAGGDRARRPARDRRRAPAAPRARRRRRRRAPADDPVAGAAGAPDPAARHRLAARDRGAVPLRPAADRPQHARGPGRHPGAAARSPRARSACRRGARLRLVELPLALPSILAGIKTVGGDRRRHRDARRAGRRGRLRPADPDRHPPGRLRPDPAGRGPGGR